MEQTLGARLTANIQAKKAVDAANEAAAAALHLTQSHAAVKQFFDNAKEKFTADILGGSAEWRMVIKIDQKVCSAYQFSNFVWPTTKAKQSNEYAKYWLDFVEWARTSGLYAELIQTQEGYGPDQPVWYELMVHPAPEASATSTQEQAQSSVGDTDR